MTMSTLIECDPAAKVACSDCAWTGTGAELEMVKDIGHRVAAGETMPAGECPECGSLAHLEDDDTKTEADELLRNLRLAVRRGYFEQVTEKFTALDQHIMSGMGLPRDWQASA